MVNFQVAIDGPAGSGKSSISNIISNKLGFVHIDTGAMYRAVTLEAINQNIDLEDDTKYDFLNNIEIVYIDHKTFLNGKDVSGDIRTPEVTNKVSTVSKHKVVRDKMLDFQRASAAHGYVLMDGRDIGTVILPNANVKIFLTASPEERAKRRLIELRARDTNISYEEVLKSIIERDHKDSTREIAPLIQAKDAILIDTTSLSIEEVCDKIMRIVIERMKNYEG